jgi:hypothetical protein
MQMGSDGDKEDRAAMKSVPALKKSRNSEGSGHINQVSELTGSEKTMATARIYSVSYVKCSTGESHD